ncbi:MAG: GxxExxY protein [Planctomycetota bacterium]
MNKVEPEIEALATAVIGAAIEVHRQLGPGFAESTYHQALRVELDLRNIQFQSEVAVSLVYKGVPIGDGRIDLLVGEYLVVELKAAKADSRKFNRQVASYLKATGLPLGLVINFEHGVLRDGIARVLNT